jgi:hypothetical protein
MIARFTEGKGWMERAGKEEMQVLRSGDRE